MHQREHFRIFVVSLYFSLMTLTMVHGNASTSWDVLGRSYMIFTWEGKYCPSSGELYSSADVMGSSMVLNWEGTYSPPFGDVLESAMVLTWEGTFCLPFGDVGERYGFDLRGHVLSIIWRGVLGSSMVLTGEGTSCPSSGGALWSFPREGTSCPPSGDVLGALWIWPKMSRPVHHLETCWGGLWCEA